MSKKDHTLLTYCPDWCGTTTCEHHHSKVKDPNAPTYYFVAIPKGCDKWSTNEPPPKAA